MSEQDKSNLSEEDFLRKHLEALESKKQTQSQSQSPQREVAYENVKASDLHYFAFDSKQFPCGIFYPSGSTIQVRAAEVREIQAYSMVSDDNFYDIVEKMNEMLSACVRIKYLDGRVGSYLELRDPDRFYLIFLIRELTFQQGSTLTTTAPCSCGKETQIDLLRKNFRIFDTNEKIRKYFDPATMSFKFKLKNGMTYHLSPPTIGLQKSFTEHIIKENSEKRKPNLSFLKVVPFLLHDRSSITMEGIKSKLDEYQKMDDVSFQFLNAAVDKMTFGIESLQKKCETCGGEVRTPMVFPDGASAIFVVPDSFEKFIEE